MFRPSLFWKIFGASLALILLTAVVAGLVAERRIVEDVEQDTRANLRTRVDLLTAAIRGRIPKDYDQAWQDELRELGERNDTRITIIRADGLVLADSSKDPRVMDDHSRRPEVIESRTQEFGTSVRHSDTVGMRMVYVAYALRSDDGSIHAYVRGALPLLRLQERLSGLRGMILGGAGIAVLFGLIAAFVIARRLSRPLRDMTAVATAIAGGDLKQRVEPSTRDELGDLGRYMNEMAARVEEHVATIQRDRSELRAILGGMGEGVIAVDTDDRTVMINDAAREILELRPDVQEGQPLWETLRSPAVAETLTEAAKHGRVHNTEVRLMNRGTQQVLSLHASPLIGEDGAPRGAVLVIGDVTEREKIEAVRRDFFTNASHELKTPIASAAGLVETVLVDPDMPLETREAFLNRVMKQMNRLGDLVEDMLALARLETAGAGVAQRRTDICGPVREVIDDAQQLAEERSITIEADLPEEEVPVTAEPESLRRIAGNLLDNAIKYSGRGSHVKVRVRREPEEVVLEVADNGPGIPVDKHDRVFERFFRVDKHRSRRLGGTGLGLAIVKHLVQDHEGKIELKSAPGSGSEFRVRLPA